MSRQVWKVKKNFFTVNFKKRARLITSFFKLLCVKFVWAPLIGRPSTRRFMAAWLNQKKILKLLAVVSAKNCLLAEIPGLFFCVRCSCLMRGCLAAALLLPCGSASFKMIYRLVSTEKRLKIASKLLWMLGIHCSLCLAVSRRKVVRCNFKSAHKLPP